jgi:small GTP-binding protein
MLLDFQLTFKIILLGDTNVGKTSIIENYVNKKIIIDYIPTIGVGFGHKSYIINKIPVKIHLWEMCGDYRFSSILKTYYQGSSAAILVFDLSQNETFGYVKKMYRELKRDTYIDNIYLLGNKIDIKPYAISKKEIDNFILDKNIKYFEICSKDYNQLKHIFSLIIDDLMKLANINIKNDNTSVFEGEDINLLEKSYRKQDSCCSIL